MPLCHTVAERTASVYNEAIATKIRQGAPLASYAIDRRCLRNASEAIASDTVHALICFFCACVYPHVSGACNQIHWRKAKTSTNTFFGYTQESAQRQVSLDTYLRKYGKDPLGYHDLGHHLDDFEDWWIDVPFWRFSCARIVLPRRSKMREPQVCR